MQKLLILQTLRGMDHLRGQPDRDLAGNIARIAEARFDGFSCTWFTREEARAASELGKAHGLIYEGLSFAGDIDALKPALEWGTEFGVHHINNQPQKQPHKQNNTKHNHKNKQQHAEQVDFAVNIETHRGRMTNDLLVTLDLIDAVPDIRFTADISHYITGREIELPVAPEMDGQIRTVLDHAFAFHGRVASCEQIQMPLSFAHTTPWIDLFKTWWTYGFESWRRRSGPDAELTFLCELGPQPYAIAGADGEDLTDRWQESLMRRDIARDCWK